MTTTYAQALELIPKLELSEQLQLLQVLAQNVEWRIAPRKRRSILELEGLGAEIWEGIDAQTYVDRERDSWG